MDEALKVTLKARSSCFDEDRRDLDLHTIEQHKSYKWQIKKNEISNTKTLQYLPEKRSFTPKLEATD